MESPSKSQAQWRAGRKYQWSRPTSPKRCSVCPVTGWACQQGGEYPESPRVDFNFHTCWTKFSRFGGDFFGRNLFASISFHVKLLGEVGTIPSFLNFHLFNFVFFLFVWETAKMKLVPPKKAQLLQLGHQVNLCQKISRWVEVFLFFGRVFLHKTELFTQTWCTFVFKCSKKKHLPNFERTKSKNHWFCFW